MKVLIVSDSHGRTHYLDKAIAMVGNIDYILHLGDLEGDEDYLPLVAYCEVVMVSGNNDYFTRVNREELITIGKYTIFLTHGHRYQVYYGLDTIKEAAKNRGANIVMFGHTHMPLIDLSEPVWAINPGSISLPRQEGRNPSFILMEIDREGEAHFTINYIK